MKKIVIPVLMLLVVLSGSLYAQERTITGKVTDAADGSGLPGVNIAIVGTAQGTITDMDGNFSINVPGDNASPHKKDPSPPFLLPPRIVPSIDTPLTQAPVISSRFNLRNHSQALVYRTRLKFPVY